MAGIKKLGCLGVLSRKTSKNPQKDESYLEGFRTDPYCPDNGCALLLDLKFENKRKQDSWNTVFGTISSC